MFNLENLSTVIATPGVLSSFTFLLEYIAHQFLSPSTLLSNVLVNGITINTRLPSLTRDFTISVLPTPAPASIRVIIPHLFSS